MTDKFLRTRFDEFKLIAVACDKCAVDIIFDVSQPQSGRPHEVICQNCGKQLGQPLANLIEQFSKLHSAAKAAGAWIITRVEPEEKASARS